MKFIEFIGKALSEKGSPSSKRIMSLIFCLLICYGEVFHLYKKGEFNTHHLYALLCAIMMLAGIATAGQVVELIRGTKSTDVEDKEKNKKD